jgi:hypothetical protein
VAARGWNWNIKKALLAFNRRYVRLMAASAFFVLGTNCFAASSGTLRQCML